MMNEESFKFLNANLIFKFSIFLLFLIIPLFILFFWQENLTIGKTISHEKFGTFGDFFGGVIGSTWALCGVILFYLALKEQRADFANNRDALLKQIEALEVQTEEFKLQREELKESRKIFTEQAKTLKLQRFESTFFSLIDLYNKIMLNLSNQDNNKNYFKSLKTKLHNEFERDNIDGCYKSASKSYLKLFYEHKEELTYYYRTIYRILSIVDNSELTDLEKVIYVKILRSQLSENELLLIYYNADTKYGRKLYPYILKYNLLKHLPSLSKLEFQFYVKKMQSESDFHQFNSYFFDALRVFIENLQKNINEEEFEKEEISFKLESNENVFIKFFSNEITVLNINFIIPDGTTSLLDFNLDIFEKYFQNLLSDFFIYSRYNSNSKFNIKCQKSSSLTDKTIIFTINSEIKIQLNKD